MEMNSAAVLLSLIQGRSPSVGYDLYALEIPCHAPAVVGASAPQSRVYVFPHDGYAAWVPMLDALTCDTSNTPP